MFEAPYGTAPSESEVDPHLHALHTAVNCYLSTLSAMANCIGAACPEVGGLYRHRLSRLRSRLAFDSSPDAMVESTAAVDAELTDGGEVACASGLPDDANAIAPGIWQAESE